MLLIGHVHTVSDDHVWLCLAHVHSAGSLLAHVQKTRHVLRSLLGNLVVWGHSI